MIWQLNHLIAVHTTGKYLVVIQKAVHVVVDILRSKVKKLVAHLVALLVI